MKKILSVILCVFMLVGLVACGGGSDYDEELAKATQQKITQYGSKIYFDDNGELTILSNDDIVILSFPFDNEKTNKVNVYYLTLNANNGEWHDYMYYDENDNKIGYIKYEDGDECWYDFVNKENYNNSRACTKEEIGYMQSLDITHDGVVREDNLNVTNKELINWSNWYYNTYK